jgi:hypothetical protein
VPEPARTELALPGEVARIFDTEDARLGVEAFATRTTATWVGR